MLSRHFTVSGKQCSVQKTHPACENTRFLSDSHSHNEMKLDRVNKTSFRTSVLKFYLAGFSKQF